MGNSLNGFISSLFGVEKSTRKSEMKGQLKQLIEKAIISWDADDIYAISLYVSDFNDNPCEPTVTLGYNTEEQYRNSIEDAYNEQEARWNYAFWLQNEEFCFGIEDTADIVKDWLKENGFPYYSNDEDIPDDEYEKLDEITKAFADVLVGIVREMHESGIISKKFGREIPILIHELEYYDEVAEQNIKANGNELVRDFVDFCLNG